MKKNLLSVVLVLSIFSFIDRALGFAFKIYLSRELGATAVGVYQVAISLFLVLLSLLTSGIPLAISKFTAKYSYEKRVQSERALISAGLVIECVLSALIIIFVVLFRAPIVSILASEQSYTSLLFLLPALLFSAIAGAIKGNLWGHENFFIGSIGEIVEQSVRFLVCIAFFMLGFDKLAVASFSLSVGCLFSMLIVLVYYIAKGSRFSSPKGYLAPLIRSSAPITVSRAVGSIVGSISAIVIPFLLMSSGLTPSDAMAQYGASMGMAMPLLFLPITVVGSISFVLVPTLSSENAKGKGEGALNKVRSSILATVVISGGCVPLFYALGRPIGTFLYDNALAGDFLSFVSWTLIPLSIESITSAQMNSLDLEMRAFINYLIGAVSQFIIMFCFYGHFSVYIVGISFGVSLSLTSVLNLIAINKKMGQKINILPITAVACVGAIPTSFVCGCIFNLLSFMPILLSLTLASCISIAFYLGICFIFILPLRSKTLALCKEKVL